MQDDGHLMQGFIADLDSPMFDRLILDPKVETGTGQTRLEDGWRVLVDEANDSACAIGAGLRGFLKSAFGLELASGPGASGGAASAGELPERTLALAVEGGPAAGAGAVRRDEFESFSYHAEADRILITAPSVSSLRQAQMWLENQMALARAPVLPIKRSVFRRKYSPRILRSFFAPYYESELLQEKDFYPDNYLDKLAHQGVNAVWLHEKLREVVPSSVFPEFGSHSARMIENLNRTIEKCGRFGIRVYVYLNEPRAFSAESEFYEKYPHLRGEPGSSLMDHWDHTYALCSSTDEVRTFLCEGTKSLFESASGLAGLILITASEHHTHCYSHVNTLQTDGEYPGTMSCPRCRDRSPADVISEVIGQIRNGAKEAAEDSEIIAWTWSWTLYEESPFTELVRSLPRDVVLMHSFERGAVEERLGKENIIDEYSLSYIGPSGDFVRKLQEGGKSGLPSMAKLQIVTTHELATVPYLPLPYNVGRKYERMAELNPKGVMLCWAFGNYPSMPLEVAEMMSWSEKQLGTGRDSELSCEEAVQTLMLRDYGEEAAPLAVEAHKKFTEAFAFFPFGRDNSLLYVGPMNRAPAYPFFYERLDRPMPFAWLRGDYGDRMEDWTRSLGEDYVLKCFRRLCQIWEEGLEKLRSATKMADTPFREKIEKHLGVCRAVHQCYASTVHLTEYVRLRNEYHSPQADEARKGTLAERIVAIIGDERAQLQDLLPILEADPRLGYHSEGGFYMFNHMMVRQKIEQLAELREKYSA